MQQNLNEIEILPYISVNGKWSLPDSFVKSFFEKIERDGIVPHVFYDGKVRTTDQFLGLLKNHHNFHSFIMVDGSVKGLAWLNDLNRNHASVHFLSLKEVWGHQTVRMGRKILECWFSIKDGEGSPRFDLLLGVTPAPYKTVLRFIKQIGCTLIGEAPKVLYNGYEHKYMNAVFSYIERPV